jgi:hypothetical protein
MGDDTLGTNQAQRVRQPQWTPTCAGLKLVKVRLVALQNPITAKIKLHRACSIRSIKRLKRLADLVNYVGVRLT